MKNAAINNLTYAGIDTLSQHTGKTKTMLKKLKNSGGKSLFDFLSYCFTGDFDIAMVNRPTKIMLLKKSVDESYSTSNYESASGFIYLLTKPEKLYNSSGGSTVCYSFIIPREYLENDFNCIGLYPDSATTSNANEYSAVCDISAVDIPMTASAVLVVDWELVITNQAGNIDSNVNSSQANK
jgi:hypothetical protein